MRSSNNDIPPTRHCTFPENSMDPVGFDEQRPSQQTTDDVGEKEDYGTLNLRGLREEKDEQRIVQQDTEEKQERELATRGSHNVRRAVLQEHHSGWISSQAVWFAFGQRSFGHLEQLSWPEVFVYLLPLQRSHCQQQSGNSSFTDLYSPLPQGVPHVELKDLNKVK